MKPGKLPFSDAFPASLRLLPFGPARSPSKNGPITEDTSAQPGWYPMSSERFLLSLIVALPYSNKAGILVCLYVTGVGTPGFVIALAWVNNCVTGHTKKVCIYSLLFPYR